MGSYPSKSGIGIRSSSGGNLAQSGYFFRCALCRRVPTSPRALPCLHTFCQDCLVSLVARDPVAAARGGLVCPQCGRLAPPRDPSQPPESWPSLYPPNVYLETLMPAVTPTGRCLCRHKEERQTCRQCQARYCDRCGIPHSQPDKNTRRKHSAIRLAKMTEEKAARRGAGDGCLDCGGSGFTSQERICSHGQCFDCVAERAVKSSLIIHTSSIRFQAKKQTSGSKSGGSLEAKIPTNLTDKDMESSKAALDSLANRSKVLELGRQDFQSDCPDYPPKSVSAEEKDSESTRGKQTNSSRREITSNTTDFPKNRETLHKDETGNLPNNTFQITNFLRVNDKIRAETRVEAMDSGTKTKESTDAHSIVFISDRTVSDKIYQPLRERDREDRETDVRKEAGAAMQGGSSEYSMDKKKKQAAASGRWGNTANSKKKELFSKDPCEVEGPQEHTSIDPFVEEVGASQASDRELRDPDVISGNEDVVEFPWCESTFSFQPNSPASPQDDESQQLSRGSGLERGRKHSLFYERYRKECQLARKNTGKGTSFQDGRRTPATGWSSPSSRSAAGGRRQGSLTGKQQSLCDPDMKDGTGSNCESTMSVRPTFSFQQTSQTWEPEANENSHDPGIPLRFRRSSSKGQAAQPDSPPRVEIDKLSPFLMETVVGESATKELYCFGPVAADGRFECSTLPRRSSSGSTLKIIMSCGSGREGSGILEKADTIASEERARGSLEDCVVSPSQDTMKGLAPKKTVSFSGKSQDRAKDQPGKKLADAGESNPHFGLKRAKRRRSVSEPAVEDINAIYRDVEPALLTDVIVMPGNRVLATDWRNQCLKSWRWGDDSSSDVLPLEGGPHALAKMAEDTVAVSVPDARRLVLVHVSPRSRLARLQTWSTRRRLYGLAFLGDGKMAATCPWDKLIEIRTIETGQVEMTLNVPSHFPALAWPEHLCVTSDGRMVVSEAKNGNLVCLDEKGEMLWSLSDVRKPLGSCWDGDRTLFVADGLGRSVWRVDESGHHAEEIITPYNLPGLGSPRSVAWHQGMLFICETADIRVLCPKQGGRQS